MNTVTPYKTLEGNALAAGVSPALAHLLYNVARDAEQHQWRTDFQDWAGNETAMISCALKDPETMADACNLLLATDGLDYIEGQITAGISDEQKWSLTEWILSPPDRGMD